MKGDQKKFLIIGTGRCGSSLIASILANAGANFGIPPVRKWNRKSGTLEHPYLIEAYKWYSREQKIKNSIIPESFGLKFCRNQCIKYLKKLFDKADFAKSSKLVWLVKRIDDCTDFQLNLIGIYRNFTDYLLSYYRRFGEDYDYWRRVWFKVYWTILLESRIYRSVLISYEELVDFKETEWATNLSQLTGLDRNNLLTWREKVVDKSLVNRLRTGFFEDEETQELYRKLRLNNKNFLVQNK